MRQGLLVIAIVTYSLLSFAQSGDGTGKGGGPGRAPPISAPPGRGPGPAGNAPKSLRFEAINSIPKVVGIYLEYMETKRASRFLDGNLGFMMGMAGGIGMPVPDIMALECANEELKICPFNVDSKSTNAELESTYRKHAACYTQVATALELTKPTCSATVTAVTKNYLEQINKFFEKEQTGSGMYGFGGFPGMLGGMPPALPVVQYAELSCAGQQALSRCPGVVDPVGRGHDQLEALMTGEADCLAKLATEIQDSDPLCNRKMNEEIEKYRTAITAHFKVQGGNGNGDGKIKGKGKS